LAKAFRVSGGKRGGVLSLWIEMAFQALNPAGDTCTILFADDTYSLLKRSRSLPKQNSKEIDTSLSVLRNLYGYYMMSAELQKQREMAREVRQCGKHQGDMAQWINLSLIRRHTCLLNMNPLSR
jgi:hypothetical protein